MKPELKNLQKIYLDYTKEKGFPLPRIIHVETRTKCNAFCNFCPASVTTDKRKDIYMPDELIEKIINELEKLDYPNRLSFYNNNEPFLDERIFQIIKTAREKIPKAYIELKSNGTVLTIEKVLKIFNAGLDMLYINYFQDHNLSRINIQKIKEELEEIRRFKGHLEGNQYFTRIKIYFRDANEIMGTRAGNSPNKTYKGRPLRRMCLRPCEMMTISPEGKVSVCSEDFFYSMNMGNIKEQDLLRIWSSKEWNDLRQNLIMGNRSSREACSKCDYKGFTYEMLKENELNIKPFWCLPRITRTVKHAIKRIKPNLRK